MTNFERNLKGQDSAMTVSGQCYPGKFFRKGGSLYPAQDSMTVFQCERIHARICARAYMQNYHTILFLKEKRNKCHKRQAFSGRIVGGTLSCIYPATLTACGAAKISALRAGLPDMARGWAW